MPVSGVRGTRGVRGVLWFDFMVYLVVGEPKLEGFDLELKFVSIIHHL